jgi:propanol-preferring alcohol dehydrogenase
MRAMVLTSQAPIGEHGLDLQTLPRPEPAAGELLVRVAACALCRTDLHIVEGELPLVRTPIVPGHQVVGRVEQVGPGVSHLRPGDRVGVAWLRSTCGACRPCASGRENLCERAQFTGYHADGGFAEYTVVPAGFAYQLPDVFADAAAAPLLCAGIIGYRALTLTGVGRGGRLVLYGFGSSAHLTLQVAVARAIDVSVVTRSPAARALARELGAIWTGDLTARPPTPAEGAIIFAPAGELVPLALRSLAPGGTLALAGIYMSRIPPLDHADLYPERRILSVANNTRDDGRRLLAEAAAIPVRPAVTTFPLAEANRALGLLKRGAVAGSAVLVTGAA